MLKAEMMKTKIHYIEDYKPHLVVHGRNAVHSFPLEFFNAIVNQAIKISEADDLDDWLPTIIHEWLDSKGL